MSKFMVEFEITRTSWYEYEVEADDKDGAAHVAEDMHYGLGGDEQPRDKSTQTTSWQTYVREVK